MKAKKFNTLMNIALIILMTLLILGEFFAIHFNSMQLITYLEKTQAGYLTTFSIGGMSFVVFLLVCIGIDYLVVALFNKLETHLYKKYVRSEEVLYYQPYGVKCPLGGVSSRERCDYCTHFKGELNGKEYKNKGYFMCNKQ